MEIRLHLPRPDDVLLLASMNRALIREEGSRNPMTLAELEERMRRWMAEGWRAALIEAEGETVGYALWRERRDEYFPEKPEVYVRHLFIAPEHRGRSIGSGAFEQLVSEFFPPGSRIVLEVLETNPRGRRFWERLGFEPYCTTFQRSGEERSNAEAEKTQKAQRAQ